MLIGWRQIWIKPSKGGRQTGQMSRFIYLSGGGRGKSSRHYPAWCQLHMKPHIQFTLMLRAFRRHPAFGPKQTWLGSRPPILLGWDGFRGRIKKRYRQYQAVTNGIGSHRCSWVNFEAFVSLWCSLEAQGWNNETLLYAVDLTWSRYDSIGSWSFHENMEKMPNHMHDLP